MQFRPLLTRIRKLSANLPSRSTRTLKYFKFKERQKFNLNNPYIWVVGTTTVLGVTYYMYHLETVPYSGRRRFMNTSARAEKAMGLLEYQNIMRRFHYKLLPPNDPTCQFVQRIAKNIIAASNLEGDWEVNVINDPVFLYHFCNIRRLMHS